MEKELFDEREIDLKQLVVLTLLHWKPILGIAVFFMLAGACYKYMAGTTIPTPVAKLTTAQTNLRVESREEYDNAMIKYNQQKASNAYLRELYAHEIEMLAAQLKSQEEFIDKSLRMKLDPEDVAIASAELYITVQNGGDTLEEVLADGNTGKAAVINSYSYQLWRTDYLDEIAAGMDTTPGSIQELILVNTLAELSGLTISVRANETKDAEAILNAILRHAEQIHEEIAETVGEHTVVVSGQTVIRMPDNMTLSWQNGIWSDRRTMEWNLASAQSALAGLTEPVEPVLPTTVKEGSGDTINSVRQATVTDIVKYGGLGFIGGLLVGCFAVAVYLILGNRVFSAEEMNRRYHLREITVFPKSEKMKGFNAFVRRFDADASYLRMPAEERLALAASNLSVYAANEKRIVLTGSVGQQALEKVQRLLADLMENREILCAPNLMRSAASMEMIREQGCVVLVESAVESRYSEIDREMQQLSNWNRDIIGSIVI